MKYQVYTDLAERRATIHEATCRYVLSRRDTLKDDNWWHGPYETLSDAENSVEHQTIRNIRRCSVCAP